MKQHKARLVSQSFLQKHGVEYDETFCPVVRFESIRTVIALAAKHDLKLPFQTTARLEHVSKNSLKASQKILTSRIWENSITSWVSKLLILGQERSGSDNQKS